MPDSNMRKFSKWGSVNTDSGISLFSSDTMKHKDAMSISGSSTSSVTKPQRTQMLPPEAIPSAASKMAQQLEDARRFVKQNSTQPSQVTKILLLIHHQIETLPSATTAITTKKRCRTTAIARKESSAARPYRSTSHFHRTRANDDSRLLVL